MSAIERALGITELTLYELGAPWWTAPVIYFAAGAIAGWLAARAWHRRRCARAW